MEQQTGKEKVFISGHKNPDSDSICSAYCYAHLKNQIDKEKIYVPVAPGNLNNQTKFIFQKFKIEPPAFQKDIYPRVKDVMTRNVVSVHEDEPLLQVMKNIHDLNINLTPVKTDNNNYVGAVTMYELTDFFMQGGISNRPLYSLYVRNISKTLEGVMLQNGEQDQIEVHLTMAAMPLERFKTVLGKLQLEKTMLIVGNRNDIVQYALERPLAGIVFTGIEDTKELTYNFSSFKGFVFVSALDTAETIRRITFSSSVKSFMNKDLQGIDENEYLETVKKRMVEQHLRELPVLNTEKQLCGIITRTDLIKKNNPNLILMDHNELAQAIDGAESANILEIIDHHRLGTIKTKTPIHFYAKPIGSTCSLVYELYKVHNVELTKEIASILLSGILSDTVILKSPTTTEADRKIVKELAKISQLDIHAYGLEIFSSTESLKNREPLSIVQTDFKTYDEFGKKVGVGQVEVATLAELNDVKSVLFETLQELKTKMSLAWAMLLITDIIEEKSILLTTELLAAEQLLAYKEIAQHEFSLPNVISRKKQLLPEILRVLEAIGDN